MAKEDASDAWVIIPGYNESKNIGKVISEVKKYSNNIIIVDDGSKDNTYDIALSCNVVVLRHIINLGKGVALKTGCDYALEKGAKMLIAIDADGQHEPKEIPRFIRALIEGNNIVFGYREFTRDMPAVFRFGNWFITSATGLLYGLKLKDTQSGYRAFTADAYKKIRWESSGYAMESEMIANAGKHRLKYAEIMIKTIYAEKYKGTTVLDGIRIVLNMLSWRFKR